MATELDDDDLPIRHAARALIVDAADRVLLFHGRIHENPPRLAWYLPGGRLEPGETHVDALRRELVEEIGLHDAAIGTHIGTREAVRHGSSGRVRSHSRLYVVRVDAHEVVTPADGSEAGIEWRWWTTAEVAAAPPDTFIPATLPSLVADLVT